jgi:hypothetical protein
MIARRSPGSKGNYRTISAIAHNVWREILEMQGKGAQGRPAA